MNLDAFLHNLHFDIEKVNPPDWEVNWEDAPLPFKLYRGLPVVELSLEVPLSLERGEEAVKPNISNIAYFLWYVFGLTQFSESVLTGDYREQSADVMQSYRRYVPSGGALYPNELYVYLKIEDLPAGVYHYDVAHHRLVLLRAGNFDAFITRALGNRCEVSSCFGTVFVSTLFWKNFFKYNNFAYRLQGLDAGVVIGQLLEVSKRFGYESQVYFQFLDRAMNHLLGLFEQEESVYAVIPLSMESTILSINRSDEDELVSVTKLCRELPAIQSDSYLRSQRVSVNPMVISLNEACMLESVQSFLQIKSKERLNGEGAVIALPKIERERLSGDIVEKCRNRFSPNMDFILGKISQWQLRTLLEEATTSFLYQNDLDETEKEQDSRISLYCCLYNVEGIPEGAYQYDSASHSLRQVQPGDHRHQLQSGLTGANVNLYQVPLCFHVVGDRDFFTTVMGFRGYRIQQMEAGMLVQRLLLAASAIGLGGHPLLGFDTNMCDEIYKLESQGKTSLIQIPIGPYRQRSWLKGSLYS